MVEGSQGRDHGATCFGLIPGLRITGSCLAFFLMLPHTTFLYNPELPAKGLVLPTVGCALPRQSLVKTVTDVVLVQSDPDSPSA